MTVVRWTDRGDDARAQAFATLVSAFVSDPVERWLYPDAGQYLTRFPEFLAALGGKAFDEQTVWSVANVGGVALWLPPGTEPDGDTIITVLTESVAIEKHADMFSVLEQMTVAHPAFAHWYLPWFGVDAAHQGRGLGGQLLKACLTVVDDSHLPAYLETPNPRNIPFYERHGFAVTGHAQAGSCPPVAFMLRASR
jgi:GNAT superfamily N-acetyltransferase